MSQLKKENSKLHEKIVKLEVQLISARNRIAALEKGDAATPLSPAEATARIAELERELGITKP